MNTVLKSDANVCLSITKLTNILLDANHIFKTYSHAYHQIMRGNR